MATTLVLFAARSTKGIKRLSKADRSAMQLQGDLLGAFIGILLSDGCLQRRTPTSNTRFLFVQSGKEAKREYYTLVFNMFISYISEAVSNLGIVVKTFTDPLYPGITYSKVSFATLAFPCFNRLHELFYVQGIKVVPSIIVPGCSPLLSLPATQGGNRGKRAEARETENKGPMPLCTHRRWVIGDLSAPVFPAFGVAEGIVDLGKKPFGAGRPGRITNSLRPSTMNYV